MKRFFVCSVSVCFFLFVGAVLADVTMRDIWRWGLVRKTDLPGLATTQTLAATTAALAVHTNRADNPHSVTAVQIGALTAELDPVANAALTVHTNRIDNPHGVTAVQIGALTAELDPVANAKLVIHTNRTDNPHNVTAAQIGALTEELDPVANAALAVHTNRADNPHGVTAAQVGALTAEQDLAALRAYHYGSPDIVESPEEWFTIDIYGSVAIADATKVTDWDIVVPWEIGGNTVLGIRAGAFLTMPDYIGMPVTSIYMSRGVNKIENMAFYGAYLLTNLVFAGTPPLMVNGSLSGVAAGLVATVQDPQATGWGSTLSDGGISIPVVRPALHADNIYQGGDRVSTENYVNQKIAAAPEWLEYGGVAGALTVTNDCERPVRVTGAGDVAVGFAGLREPLPVYLELAGFSGVSWPGAHVVGGGFYQTNMVNIYVAWRSGTNVFINPVTARPQ